LRPLLVVRMRWVIVWLSWLLLVLRMGCFVVVWFLRLLLLRIFFLGNKNQFLMRTVEGVVSLAKVLWNVMPILCWHKLSPVDIASFSL